MVSHRRSGKIDDASASTSRRIVARRSGGCVGLAHDGSSPWSPLLSLIHLFAVPQFSLPSRTYADAEVSGIKGRVATNGREVQKGQFPDAHRGALQ
jgi:hypothetical protein